MPETGRLTQLASYRLLAEAAKKQTVSATGRPNKWRELGAQAVDRHADALRRLADA